MNDTTFQGDGKVAYVPVVINTKPQKQTNADRIRAMTDEELADYLRYYSDSYARYDMDWLEWLKQEANE